MSGNSSIGIESPVRRRRREILTARGRPLLRRSSSAVPYLLLLVLVVLGGVLIPGSLGRTAIISTVALSSVLGIAAAGQTLTILIGGIDLSIPAVMGMAAVLVVQFYGNGMSFAVAVLVVAGVAIIVGAVNGLVSVILRIHPLVVTLGVGSIVTGCVLISHQARNLQAGTAGALPAWLTTFSAPIAHTGPIPLPPVIVSWIVVTVLVIGAQRWTTIGRRVYAMGASPRAAELSGIRPDRVWALVYIISALFACMAGIILAGMSAGANVDIADPYLFMTVAAVVVGGTSLLGGRGGYGRTVVGALIVTELSTIVLGLNLSNAMQQLFIGILIVALVMLYGRDPSVRSRV